MHRPDPARRRLLAERFVREANVGDAGGSALDGAIVAMVESAMILAFIEGHIEGEKVASQGVDLPSEEDQSAATGRALSGGLADSQPKATPDAAGSRPSGNVVTRRPPERDPALSVEQEEESR